MPEENPIPRLSRLSNILILLQSKRLITAQQIADKFGISKRTAYRDIKALEESGVPIITEEGKGYSLLEGYNLPPVMFTEEEANALITAQNIIIKNKDKSLINSYLSAITKLKAVLRNNQKDKTELLEKRIAIFDNFEQEITSQWLSSIQLAITHFKVLKIQYHSISKEELTNRLIEPMALYHSQGNWVLIAWCRLRGAYREFRLDRIQSLFTTNEVFDNRGFDLVKYFYTAYGE